MTVIFTSQELWQIGIFVGAVFIIIFSIIICLSGGLRVLCSWCSDLDWKFQCFFDDLNPITLWYEFLINLKIISLKIYCYFVLFFKLLFINNSILFLFLIITIIISYSYPDIIIYKLFPVMYLIFLLIYTFISMKKLDEEYEKKNKDMK